MSNLNYSMYFFFFDKFYRTNNSSFLKLLNSLGSNR